MKAVLQRVTSSSVIINADEQNVRSIGSGFMVLVGFCEEDNESVADYMAEKILGLRVFEDNNGNMNLSLTDISGELLIISQFTLYANCKKGRRPSFTQAAKPDKAIPLYEYFLNRLRQTVPETKSGEFGADMQVSLVNDGPVTIVLDSNEIMPVK